MELDLGELRKFAGLHGQNPRWPNPTSEPEGSSVEWEVLVVLR